jgi:hypothetical protein
MPRLPVASPFAFIPSPESLSPRVVLRCCLRGVMVVPVLWWRRPTPVELVVVVPRVPIAVPVVPRVALVALVLVFTGRVARVVFAPRMRSIKEGL